MRFVVTGSNGLVGSRVCALLEQGGHQVVGLGRGAQRTQGALRYIGVDLTLEADVLNAIESATPDVIIHTASMTEVDACEKNPEAAYAANVTAAAAVAKGARKVGAHLVHVSTDYVFDGHNGPYDEEALPNPRGVYAVTKLMGEHAARVFVPNAAIARTAVVFGWPAAGRPNFGAWLVGALEKKQPLKLFEDQFVSASLADSVAAMVAELGERKLGGIWNTCGGEVVNRVAFGQALCQVFGFDASLITPSKLADLKLPSPRPLHSGLKVDKARAQLKAKPLALSEALSRFHAAWKAGATPSRGG
ncbi:SDR family oxidoreductase [Hyalangium rubrum]|uniref:dTDP-4-dehydrorhamnose reductase n=1 Tax=Hyalangium rubrum TaxID=3103134 RepID=A0ABU5H7V7_9BACT|nr:SDR family oxidoreductase [Hyalangium sp. s54d21]MDY7229547.1 SDR family oxidoreductase [Hyalangium sp. s54d21]